MNNKKTLMIHEIRDWMFDLQLEDYILTFDDGLFSQYYYLEEFKKINTPKIFFVSSNIICPEDIEQNLDFPHCDEAHEDFFSNGNASNYMKWSQVKKISKTPLCTIGGHSHNHNIYKNLKIQELYKNILEDTEKMVHEFKKNEIELFDFCFPYNNQYTLYAEILKKFNIHNHYGKERIAIESLR